MGPVVQKGWNYSSPSLENLIDMLATILMRRLEVMQFLAQIIDIVFQAGGFLVDARNTFFDGGVDEPAIHHQLEILLAGTIAGAGFSYILPTPS